MYTNTTGSKWFSKEFVSLSFGQSSQSTGSVKYSILKILFPHVFTEDERSSLNIFSLVCYHIPDCDRSVFMRSSKHGIFSEQIMICRYYGHPGTFARGNYVGYVRAYGNHFYDEGALTNPLHLP